MGTTVRLRFVAFDLVGGWFEFQRKGVWRLKHPDRKGELALSMFPVAEGITMTLETLRALSRERSERLDALVRRASEMRGHLTRTFLLDETTWTAGWVFCLARSVRTEPPPRASEELPKALRPRLTYTREWTVCDGAHVLEAVLREHDDATFRASADDGDLMMRSVRFEGPS